MDQLIQGIHQFQSLVYQRERAFFEKLAAGQSPSTMFITCSDSRVDPTLITQSTFGELFVLRNAGNLIPAFGASTGGEGATIEYAIVALGVKDIVVCGHTRCGAIQALLNPPTSDSLSLVRRWLDHGETTRRIMRENYPPLPAEELCNIAAQEHVLVQIENLQTHPAVAASLQRGELTLHGWIYQIEHGQILAYCSDKETFVPLVADQPAPQPPRARGAVRRAPKKK